MHEIGIANSILDAVSTEAASHPGAIPRKVAVRIGELAAVEIKCPQCGEARTECIGGDQLELAYLELQEAEEHESSTA